MMELLPLAGSLILLGLGFLGMLAPSMAAALVGIKPDGPMGTSEIRVTYGAMFVGMGACALYFRSEVIFLMLGLTSLFAAIIRAISLIVDQSASAKNLGAIVFEALLGLLFLTVLL